jgi:endonuclease G
MAVKIEKLQKFAETEGQAFLDRPNVTSIGVGYKVRNGKRTAEPCIRFTVSKKIALEALEGEGLPPLPKTIKINGDTVPTDVEERRFEHSYAVLKEVEQDPRKLRQNPVMPGISVCHIDGTAGTLGCIVYTKDGRPCMLSNWHVFHGPSGKIGDPVVQPGPHDDNRTGQNRVGSLARSHLGLAGDAAIAFIEGRKFDRSILDLGVAVSELVDPQLGDRVVKSGRTTAITHGIVSSISMTVKIDYGPGVGSRRIGGFEVRPDPKHRAANDEISMGGDSGSVWLLKDDKDRPTGKMVGLHFGGESADSPDEHALACKATSVFKKLEIALEGPSGEELEATKRKRKGEALSGFGYDQDFLGQRIGCPSLAKDVEDDELIVKGSEIISHTHYSLVMSRTRKFARWVAWNIDGEQLKAYGRKGLDFDFDPDVDEKYQFGNDLYVSNKLDRGHIARRADLVWGDKEEAQRANRESFYYTNMTPQHARFNQSGAGGLWGRLENAIFEDLSVSQCRLSVFGGPIFKEQDPRYRGAKIPLEFWKVIAFIDEETSRLQLKGFILSQANLKDDIEAFGLEEFRLWELPLSRIEERAQVRFGFDRNERETLDAADVRKASGVREILTRADITI